MKAAWIGPDGRVERTNSWGDTKRFFPGGTAYRPDGFNVLSEGGSPWDMTYEPAFDLADRSFPGLIAWLSDQVSAHRGRTQGLSIGEPYRSQLAECLASLVVRSPRMREQTERYIAHRQVHWAGFAEPRNVEFTAGGALSQLQKPFATAMRTGGKIGILIAPTPSFLFGDGFMHNFHDNSHIPLRAMAMVALTPTIAVLWFCPGSYPIYPEAVTLALSVSEVASFNDLVQIYSRDAIYHVEKPAELHESFRAREFHIAAQGDRRHSASAVDGWMAEVLSMRWPG